MSEVTLTPPDLATRISTARTNAELTQAQLARLLGVRKETILRWEAGLADPRANKLMALAGITGVAVTWLMTGQEAPDQHTDPATQLQQLRDRMNALEQQQRQLLVMAEELSLQLGDAEARWGQPALSNEPIAV